MDPNASRVSGSLNSKDLNLNDEVSDSTPELNSPRGQTGQTTGLRAASHQPVDMKQRNYLKTSDNGRDAQATEQLLEYDHDEDDGIGGGPKRSNSLNLDKMATTQWFDTMDEAKKHHKSLKRSLRLSGKIDPANDDDNKMLKSLKHISASRMFLGGTDAFDVGTRSDMAEMMASLGPAEGDDEETRK